MYMRYIGGSRRGFKGTVVGLWRRSEEGADCSLAGCSSAMVEAGSLANGRASDPDPRFDAVVG